MLRCKPSAAAWPSCCNHNEQTIPPLLPFAELMERFVDKAGREKVQCIVTDDASNMKKARIDLTGQAAYKHIIAMR